MSQTTNLDGYRNKVANNTIKLANGIGNKAAKGASHLGILGYRAAEALEVKEHRSGLFKSAKYKNEDSGAFMDTFKKMANQRIAIDNAVVGGLEVNSTKAVKLTNRGIAGIGSVLGTVEAWIWNKLFDAKNKSPISDLAFGITAAAVAGAVRLSFLVLEGVYKAVSVVVGNAIGAAAGVESAVISGGKKAGELAKSLEFRSPITVKKAPEPEIGALFPEPKDEESSESSSSSTLSSSSSESSSVDESGEAEPPPVEEGGSNRYWWNVAGRGYDWCTTG